MKSFRFLLAVAMIGTLLTYSGCGKSSDPTPSVADQQLKKLSAIWKATTVTIDGGATNPSNAYANFVLTMSGTAGNTTFDYSSTGRPALSPWAASGKFTFGTDAGTTLVRDDNLTVSYSVTDSQLIMTFNYGGNGFSRVDNVKGNWSFTFTKQ